MIFYKFTFYGESCHLLPAVSVRQPGHGLPRGRDTVQLKDPAATSGCSGQRRRDRYLKAWGKQTSGAGLRARQRPAGLGTWGLPAKRPVRGAQVLAEPSPAPRWGLLPFGQGRCFQQRVLLARGTPVCLRAAARAARLPALPGCGLKQSPDGCRGPVCDFHSLLGLL